MVVVVVVVDEVVDEAGVLESAGAIAESGVVVALDAAAELSAGVVIVVSLVVVVLEASVVASFLWQAETARAAHRAAARTADLLLTDVMVCSFIGYGVENTPA